MIEQTKYKLYVITDTDNNIVDYKMSFQPMPDNKIEVMETLDRFESQKHPVADDNGIYLKHIIDGKIKDRPEADKAADLRAQKITLIKAQAQTVIESQYPLWKQNNIQSRALEILEKLAAGETLTTEEEADKAGIKAVEGWIKGIRQQSDDMEAALDVLDYEDLTAYTPQYTIT